MHSFQGQARTPNRQGSGQHPAGGGAGSGFFNFNTPASGGRLLRHSYRSASRDRHTVSDGKDRLGGFSHQSPRATPNSHISTVPMGAMSVGRQPAMGKPGTPGFRCHFGAVQNPQKLTDHRNTSSEHSKRESLKTVMRYLNAHHYPNPLTPKQLSSPSRAIYLDIVVFLIGQVDPQLPQRFSKLEEDVPRFFKEIGYHATINKTLMISPGAPNTWPQHLAAMAWLCDLLSYEAEVFPQLTDPITSSPTNGSPAREAEGGAKREDADFLAVGRWDVITQAIADSYRLFCTEASNVDDYDATEDMDIAIEQLVGRRHGEFQASREKIVEQLTSVNASIETLHSQKAECDALVERNKALETDLEILDKHIADATLSLENTNHECEIKNDAVDAINVDINVVDARSTELEETISKQGIDRNEVRKIDSDLKAKRRRLQDLRLERSEKEKEAVALRVEIRGYMDGLFELNRSVSAAHANLISTTHNSTSSSTPSASPETLEELEALPHLKLDFSMMDDSLSLNSDTAGSSSESVDHVQGAQPSVNDVFGLDWKNHKEALQKCANREDSMKQKRQRQAAGLTDVAAELQDEIKRREVSVIELQKEITKSQKEAKQYAAAEESKIKDLEQELNGVSFDIQSSQDKCHEALEKAEKAKQALEEDIGQKVAELEEIIEDGRSSFVRCASSMVQLKESTAEGFATAVLNCEQFAKSEALSANVPIEDQCDALSNSSAATGAGLRGVGTSEN